MHHDAQIVDIENLDKAAVLCALFDNARFAGGQHLNDYNPARRLMRETATHHLTSSAGRKIEVLLGRNIFIDFSNEKLIDVQMYNEKNGPKPSAQKIIANLKLNPEAQRKSPSPTNMASGTLRP